MVNSIWYEVDMRGYIDDGPACGECGACDCSEPCRAVDTDYNIDMDCIGLAHYFVYMDGGDTLCSDCYTSEIVETG